MNRVFVYGTLMRGFGNHHLLRSSRYIGFDQTADHFDLLDMGWFPAMSEPMKSGGTQIVGEVYEVSDATLARLDALEGHPHFYIRRLVPLECDSFEAWAYILPDQHCGGVRSITFESGGSWAEYRRQTRLSTNHNHHGAAR